MRLSPCPSACSCACLLLPLGCVMSVVCGGQGASPPSPHSTHVRLSRRTRGGEAEGLSSVVPQEGRITQYNLSLSTSSTRTAASKYGGALCRVPHWWILGRCAPPIQVLLYLRWVKRNRSPPVRSLCRVLCGCGRRLAGVVLPMGTSTSRLPHGPSGPCCS